MPRYEVIKPGFMNDTLHKPGHPRHGHVITDKPLKPIPSWLKLAKDESAGQKKARAKADKAGADKAKDDKQDIENASFLGEGEKSSSVETL